MRKTLTARATQVLDLLPFAQLLTKRPPSGKLLAAATIVNSPVAARLAPRLIGVARIALAVVAIGSVLTSSRRRPGFKWRPK